MLNLPLPTPNNQYDSLSNCGSSQSSASNKIPRKAHPVVNLKLLHYPDCDQIQKKRPSVQSNDYGQQEEKPWWN